MDLGVDEKAREIRVRFRGSRCGKQACRCSPEGKRKVRRKDERRADRRRLLGGMR